MTRPPFKRSSVREWWPRGTTTHFVRTLLFFGSMTVCVVAKCVTTAPLWTDWYN